MKSVFLLKRGKLRKNRIDDMKVVSKKTTKFPPIPLFFDIMRLEF